MSIGRLRSGELLAGGGALALFVLLFFDWFGAGVRIGRLALEPGQSGWSSLGWPVLALLVVIMLVAAWLLVATTTPDAVAQAVAAGVVTATLGSLTLLVLLARVLTQPSLGVGAPNEVVEVRAAAYLGLLACLLIAVGGWWTIADERTSAPESATTPPPARPVPPAV